MLPLIFLVCNASRAADYYQPGFRTIGQWSDENQQRVDMNIWYPCNKKPRELLYSPWLIRAAKDATPIPGRFPLILISHLSSGDRFSYHELGAWLASCGFIVGAPTHIGDCLSNMDFMFSWHQLQSRVTDLSNAIDILLSNDEISLSIDPGRIGLIGFGTGATASLLMGGALPDCSGWPGYCQAARTGDIYCNEWAKQRINSICASFPLQKSLADPRVRAIAAVSPGYGMIFGPNSFAYFYPPLLLVDAGRDIINHPDLHGAAIAALIGRKVTRIIIPDADQGALMSACPDSLASELPDLCLSVSQDERRHTHQRLRETIGDFFLHYLGGNGNLPDIPSPPDLSPKPMGIEKTSPTRAVRKRPKRSATREPDF